MKKWIVGIVLLLISLMGGIVVVLNLNKKEPIILNINQTVGVWWWDNSLGKQYLDFAYKNGVDEIYYCDSSLDADTAEFIRLANSKNMKVYALLGEKEWIIDKSSLDEFINDYKEYQQENLDAKFDGIHLDVEPHQYEDFNEKSEEYLSKYLSFVYSVVEENDDIHFDFDIPAWYDDEIEFNGQTKAVFKHVIDVANRVFVMSYRDNASKIVNFAQDELDYAKEQNKTIFLSVEMNSDEGDKVSFKEESKQILKEELENLNKYLNQDFGISIHHIKTWYNLKSR